MTVEAREIQRVVQPVGAGVPLRVRAGVEHVEDAKPAFDGLPSEPERAREIELQVPRRLVADLPVAARAVREPPRRGQRCNSPWRLKT